MEMCYDGALVMPNNYTVVNEEEMTYVDGGALTTGQKWLIVGVCVASAAALTSAIVFGNFWLASKIMGLTIRQVVQKAGAAAVVGCITASLGISSTTVWAAVNFITK